jgi:hypothetical protein
MHVEGGAVRYTALPGEDWTFAPSFARIEALGTPQEVVDLLAGLFGGRAAEHARYVLACLCVQDDPLPALGWLDASLVDHPGVIPADMQIVMARYLMQVSLLAAGEGVLSLPEYQSILDMPAINYTLTSPTWTAYMEHVKELANV